MTLLHVLVIVTDEPQQFFHWCIEDRLNAADPTGYHADLGVRRGRDDRKFNL